MSITLPYLQLNQNARHFLLTKMSAGVLTNISYAAVRGVASEEGAIQRILNKRRITSIKTFTLDVGVYPGAVILNWIAGSNPLQKMSGNLTFEDVPHSAQIIDGQHRIAGLRAAIAENSAIASLEIPVAIFENLETRECADIFLSINTEQKPVPRSLVFDLYGIASEAIVDQAAERARDLASSLNELEESPYFDRIKFPGSPRRKIGIALSTVVSTIKPLVEEKGNFEQIGLRELEVQLQVILNYFNVLRDKYGTQWDDKNNIFQYAAGFVGAIEFMRTRLIPYCNNIKSFKAATINAALDLQKDNLIFQTEVKGLGGKDAPKRVFDRLNEIFVVGESSHKEFEI